MRTAAKPGVLTAQRKQREAVKLVSAGRCEVEENYSGLHWARCLKKGEVAAHIYPRAKCGRARDRAEVVVFACVPHNCDHFDGRSGTRVPLAAAQLAWQTIMDAAKDKPSSRALLGPKPEKGQVPYL